MPGAACPTRRWRWPWGCRRARSALGCGAPAVLSAHNCWGPAETSTSQSRRLRRLTWTCSRRRRPERKVNMVDEIELVSQFRSDVPDPSPQARAQAWAAVMTVAAEEAAEDGTGGRPAAPAPSAPVVPGNGSPGSGAGRRPRRHRRGADGGPFAHQPPDHVPGSSTTAWQPGQPVSRAVVSKGAHSSPGALRLVSYIEGPQWQKGSEQVPPGFLDCPAVDACYVLAQTVLTTVGPYPNYYNAVYFSGDGGASWSSLELPPGLEFTTPLSCPSAQTCVGVAYQGEKNELVSTTDGGHQWLISPLRAPAGALYLSCASVSACSLVTGSSYLGPATPTSSRRPPTEALVGPCTTSPVTSISRRSRARAPADCIVIAGPSRVAPARRQRPLPGWPSSPPTAATTGHARPCPSPPPPPPRRRSRGTPASCPAPARRTALSLPTAPLPTRSWAFRNYPRTAHRMAACCGTR